MWLGPADRNTETLIGTSKGVVRAHTVERLTPSTKWDINYILDMKGTPQRPDPSKPGLHIPVRIRMEPAVTTQMPGTRPARKEEGPRSAYFSKEDFKNFGFTEGCEGCSRRAAGMAARPHSSKCRTRIEAEMRKTPSGRKRLEDADRKIHEYLERKLIAEHAETDERERPGIAGGTTDVGQATEVPGEHAQESSDRQMEDQTDGRGDRPESQADQEKVKQTAGNQSSSEGKTITRSSVKRLAEEEADDSGRGERSDWRNFVEPSSSGQAPS